ncbi:MAG TPA: FxSxx-COOH system tetratricopeptide repeat protein [Blastocatellia bacterium]|nr:FxSxx-COOH system tetratricopeptide repeat protein [Blastocatellia bacterium]
MDIPRTLDERLREGKVIPFVGAGVSMAVKDKNGERLFPSWKNLLEAAANRLDEEKKSPYANTVRGLLEIEPSDYLDAARRARQGLGPVWFQFIKEHIDRRNADADDDSLNLARAVWQLGSKLVITTNYDRVLHWACPQPNDLVFWDVEAQAEQSGLLRGEIKHPTVWHLHGHINNATNLILTPDGYSRLYPEAGEAEHRYRAALATLHQLMTSHTLLFIGFSLDDAYFGMQLRGISDIFNGTTGPHYVLTRAAERENLQRLNLPVEIITVEDHGAPLLEGMHELAKIAAETHSAPIKPDSQPNELPRPQMIASYDPRNRVFYVPFRPKGDQVIGREETMQAVREQLTSGRRTAIGQTAAFGGLGGLGKTQLAVEYAYRFQDDYPNGVVWLNADQDIDSQLIHIAEKARWVAPESEHKYKLEIAQQRIRTYSDCLLIFDNVESISAIEPFLPEPQANPHILITSRFEHPEFKRVPLELLNQELSLKLLLQEAGRHQSPTGEDKERAAREIAETLDGLPLAIELAGAYIRHRQLPWQQYLELLQQNLRAALPGRFLSGSFTKHEKDIYSTLKINEGIFQDEPLLRDILNLLTWSGSAPMGLSLMCALLDISNQAELTGALSLGIALRLLQKPPAAESYAIHRLVREVRREDVPLTGREGWSDIICQRMAKWFEDKREEFNQLPLFESEIDHLQAWEQHASAYAPKYASQLIWLQAYPSYHHGRYHDVRAQLEKAWAAFEQSNSGDLALKAHILNDLGFSYFQLGDYKRALELYQKALEIRQELFGNKHPDTATSFNNVGITYDNLGDYKRALEFEQKALEIRQELSSDKHPDTATSFDNVGSIYGYLGDPKRALELKQKALEIRQELFGDKHPDTATSFNNIGSTYDSLGDYKRALEFEQKALEIQKELFSDKHPDTATSFNNIGSTYANLSDHKRALEFKQKALEIRRDLLGEHHPNTISSAVGVAYSLFKLSRRLEARDFIEDYFRGLPHDHPSYEMVKEQRRQLLAQMTGFRVPPASKQRKSKHKKKKR